MKPLEETHPSLEEYMFEDINSRSVFNHPAVITILQKHTIDKAVLKKIIDKIEDSILADVHGDCDGYVRYKFDELRKEIEKQ